MGQPAVAGFSFISSVICHNGSRVIGHERSVMLDELAASGAIERMAYLIQFSVLTLSLRSLSREHIIRLVDPNRVGMLQFHLSTGIF